MSPDIFSDDRFFKQAFCDGLVELLQQPDLGCFILACANVFGDPDLFTQMYPDIEKQFASLEQSFTKGGLERGEISATEDDREIFQNIIQQGLENIPAVQYRQVGDWKCQFNLLRTFRPTRMAAKKLVSLYETFEPTGFNFNKGFIQKECLWEGEWQGKQLSWYYNKFPFARYHGLLVPDRVEQQPQYLTSSMHEYIWQIMAASTDNFTGLGIAYNSLGAFASVNHLHFQWFLEPEGLPVMSPRWRHNGGNKDYPLPCHRFLNIDEAWRGINNWHEQSIPYNLIYTVQGLYAFPRRIQSQVTHQDWTSGFSWTELAGVIVVQDLRAFAELCAEDIAQEMQKLSLHSSELLM